MWKSALAALIISLCLVSSFPQCILSEEGWSQEMGWSRIRVMLVAFLSHLMGGVYPYALVLTSLSAVTLNDHKGQICASSKIHPTLPLSPSPPPSPPHHCDCCLHPLCVDGIIVTHIMTSQWRGSAWWLGYLSDTSRGAICAFLSTLTDVGFVCGRKSSVNVNVGSTG